MKNSKYTVYIDMDGVVSDFNGKVDQISDGRYGNDDNYTKSKMWSDIKRWDKHVEPFFESLDKMPGADALVGFIKSNFENVKFLSAGGSTPRDNAEQKKRWVQKNYPGTDVIVVGTSAQKAVYANPMSILVDDRDKSIDPWRRAGGFGVLHTSNAQTIKELHKVLK